jgi:hypothetical protein
MSYRIITFIVWLSSMISSCRNEDNHSSFIIENTSKYNAEISSAIDNKEAWTQTPFLIVGKLFGPEYRTEGNSEFMFEQIEITINHVTVIVTKAGLLDDSAYGEKRIIEFRYELNRWVIDNIKLGFRCQPGRGHENYSGELCN